jgi:hypothetical protein
MGRTLIAFFRVRTSGLACACELRLFRHGPEALLEPIESAGFSCPFAPFPLQENFVGLLLVRLG